MMLLMVLNINSNKIWVIDPLDGTHSFIAGKPLFGTLICLSINKVPSLGIIDIPILNQRWHGGLSLGVYLNNKICKKVKDNHFLNRLYHPLLS